MPRHYLKKWVIDNPGLNIVIPAVRAGICYRVSLVIPAVRAGICYRVSLVIPAVRAGIFKAVVFRFLLSGRHPARNDEN